MMKRAGLASGFTLIEMAIVLVVIGLLLGGGLTAVAPVIENSNISQTNQRLDRIEQALVLHVIRYGCLPCPATPTTASSGTDAGEGLTSGGGYTSGCQSAACTYPTGTVQGIVPWVNLGLSENDITDGFGMRISYTMSDTLQQTSSMTRVDSSYPAGELEVRNVSQEITGGAGNRAAYVLISHGPNRAFGYRAGTGSGPSGNTYGSTVEDDNGDGNTVFIQEEYNANRGANYFDDLVRWRSAPMIVQLCGSGSCGNPS